jgi:hypothetical protein
LLIGENQHLGFPYAAEGHPVRAACPVAPLGLELPIYIQQLADEVIE